jgi:hypothetical protein
MSIPTSVGGGTLTLWLDGSDNSTITTSGSNVTAWADKSGVGHNATYYGGSYPTKANPGIYFNSSQMSLSAPLNGTFTVFMVASPSSTSECYFYGTDLGVATFIQNYIGNTLEFFNGTERFTMSSSPASTFLVNVVHSNTTVTGYYQGDSVYSGASVNMNPGTLVVLGAAQLGGLGPINATIYELIIYNSVLSEPDRKSVESYLQGKYARLLGIQIIEPCTIKGRRVNMKLIGKGNIK